MEKARKEADRRPASRLLSVVLAALMVISPLMPMLSGSNLFGAMAAGDGEENAPHTNTAWSNTDYSVIYDKLILVGRGFTPPDKDPETAGLMKNSVASVSGVQSFRVVKYLDLAALNSSGLNYGAGSLVVYSCGTRRAADNQQTLTTYKQELLSEVKNLKKTGADVLLVTPGPIVEYGENMYYAKHSAQWSPAQIAAGNNITKRLDDCITAVSEVAEEQNVGLLPLFALAKLYGEKKYMRDTVDGVYPGSSGYQVMARWIAAYVTENYVDSLLRQKEETLSEASESFTLSLDNSVDNVDAVTVSIPAGGTVPAALAVQIVKAESDQWFAHAARVKTDTADLVPGGVYSASLVFPASAVKYVKVSAEGGTLPAGTEIKVHNTRLLKPVITSPQRQANIQTNQAFNIEWSEVAGADRYKVEITAGAVVKTFITSNNTQTIPKGLLPEILSCAIKVTSIASGYTDQHQRVGQDIKVSLSGTAPFSLSSESIYENISEGKRIDVLPANSATARDGSYVLNKWLSAAPAFEGDVVTGAYKAKAWHTDPAFAAVGPLNGAAPVELVIDLNKDEKGGTVSSGSHLVTGLDIGFAVDTDAICPSSVVVSVQKEGESTWTEVGGKVYIANGLAAAGGERHIEEKIPLTSKDASPVEAARVKVTLYSDVSNGSYPAAMPPAGVWGNWYAISTLRVSGGRYIGTVEPDGATAAYHANFLQNTGVLRNRGTFGAADGEWDKIAWKSAPYKTSDSGYKESTGNITVGKVYWASEKSSTDSAKSKRPPAKPKAVNPNVPKTGTKAKQSISSIALADGNAMNLSGQDTAVLTDGNTSGTYFKGNGAGPAILDITLSQSIKVENLRLYVYHQDVDNRSFSGIGLFKIEIWDGTAYVDKTGAVSGDSCAGSTNAGYANPAYYGEVTVGVNDGASTNKIRLTYKSGGWGSGVHEIEVYGIVPPPPPPPGGHAAPITWTPPSMGSPSNWALASNGGQYKGTNGTPHTGAYADTPGITWTEFHSGQLNDSTIKTDATTAGSDNHVGILRPTGSIKLTFKLKSIVKVTDVTVYSLPRSNLYPASLSVSVGETDDSSRAASLGSTTALQDHSGVCKKHTVSNSAGAEGRYVFIEVATNSDGAGGYITNFTEIVINGTKACKLDQPEITSPDDGVDVGVPTSVIWTPVSTDDGQAVSYNIRLRKKVGGVWGSWYCGTTSSSGSAALSADAFDGEGEYQIKVEAGANGWYPRESEPVTVYYTAKQTITFKAQSPGILKSSGVLSQEFSFMFDEGAAWDSDDVKAAVGSVSAVPYMGGADGNTPYYFQGWSVSSGGPVAALPVSGSVTSATYYAIYGTTDNLGGFGSIMTNGEIYDGSGSADAKTFKFTRGSGASDYMIIDLGAIYYSLTDFDLSFYANGEAPDRVTFEVSSKVYVPTIAQGAAFDPEEDWRYVSIIEKGDFAQQSVGGKIRCHVADAALRTPIIDGAFGRYIKVTFWYGASCTGVDVDEVMVSGSDDYVRTNVASGKPAYAGNSTTADARLTDGATTQRVSGSVFSVDLGEVKTAIHSIELADAGSTAVEFYISPGGTADADYHSIGSLTGAGGVYKLAKKVSARHIKAVPAADSFSISEFRVFADPGRENYYKSTGKSHTIERASDTVELDNLVSLGAEATLNGTAAALLSDGRDYGIANGMMSAESGGKTLRYGLYTSRRGSKELLNLQVITDWEPTLGSTAFTANIGSKTYTFEFNGDVGKGFVIVTSGDKPFSYGAVRTADSWTVDFAVKYDDVSAATTVGYTITATDAGGVSVSSGAKTFYKTTGVTTGWNYNSPGSSWAVAAPDSAGKVTAQLDLKQTCYGLRDFGVTVLHRNNGVFKEPDGILFQVSEDATNWKNVGYIKKGDPDFRYYPQCQPKQAYAYNLGVSFAGVSGRYVRAVMEMPAGSQAAVQELWVNSYKEPPKAAGGDRADASFDYKMLWDKDNLYVAFRYEEGEVPFYTANHQYNEGFTLNNNSANYMENGTGGTNVNAFSISNLYYDEATNCFRLQHEITKAGDPDTETGGTYKGYSTKRLNNLRLYKISNNGTNDSGGIRWNLGDSVSKGLFVYSGQASLATTIETSTVTLSGSTIAPSSALNGYIIVSDGYALSQTIDGYSLSAKPVTVKNNAIAADQISDDIVWYFGSVWSGATQKAKNLGDYNLFAFMRTALSGDESDLYDKYFFDNDSTMGYSAFYINRAYQGEVWENIYTFPRRNAETNIGNAQIEGKRNFNSTDTFWNFERDQITGNWSAFLRGQGNQKYGNYYDNIDGASSMRLFLSPANMNDTARSDYGNCDVVIDAYVIDNNEVILSDGRVIAPGKTGRYGDQGQKVNTAWNAYKDVELKAGALGATAESRDFKIDLSKCKAKAKFDRSENGQRVLTMEIAIPFRQLGFDIQKSGSTVNRWGNFYTKSGIEKPLGKRTLMQFDPDFDYTSANNRGSLQDIAPFYYYADASEFGYILQFAPEGKGYQDMSYTKGEGYSTFSSVRGEVLNSENGKEIEYAPDKFEMGKIHSYNNSAFFAGATAELRKRDAFAYEEKDGSYYFTSRLDHARPFDQGGTMETKLSIPPGGAYFSFDWKAQTETADTLSVWVEQTATWNANYKGWINGSPSNPKSGYNCGIPMRKYPSGMIGGKWTGILDYGAGDVYSNKVPGSTASWKINACEFKNDPCVAFISGYRDMTRNPEEFMLGSWKDTKKSTPSPQVPVNIDDVMVFTPLSGGSTAGTNPYMFRHIWDWHNVTMWIPNATGSSVDYTVAWMFWKNGASQKTFAPTDGRGTDDAQITNFHLAATDELGYWKTSKNWDTLRLDADIADPEDMLLGVRELAKAELPAGSTAPAISATQNDPDNDAVNTFGKPAFYSLSYAAIAERTNSGADSYFQTKNRINISAANIGMADIGKYINNAVVFTQNYAEDVGNSVLDDWTVLELRYGSAANTWKLTRLFEPGVDKSKFNLRPNNETIIIAVNYAPQDPPFETVYGKTTEAVFYGRRNAEVLNMLAPEVRYRADPAFAGKVTEERAGAGQQVTSFITSSIFTRENYNIAHGKPYSLRHYPDCTGDGYPYMENCFRNGAALPAALESHAATPKYYIDKNGPDGAASTGSDYRDAFKYTYTPYAGGPLGLRQRPMIFDTAQYGDTLYIEGGKGQLTDGIKMNVYSDTYLVESLEDYAIGYQVYNTIGTPDADTVEAMDPSDKICSYTQTADAKHDVYEVKQDVHTREENVVIDLGAVEYGLSAFNLRFLGGGENGVTFPTSVEYSVSADGLSYACIGSVALDGTGFDRGRFASKGDVGKDAFASVIFSGNTDTVYGKTVADYTLDLQSVGVTARYIKATIMNHSAQNAKTMISEFQVIQSAIKPDVNPLDVSENWIDVSDDAILMYMSDLEKWDNSYKQEYSFALTPTNAGYLFAEDRGYPDSSAAGVTNQHTTAPDVFACGELTDGRFGSDLYLQKATETYTDPAVAAIKDGSVGWMKAHAPQVSLTFKLKGGAPKVGFISVYALRSKDPVDKINRPYDVTAYLGNSNDGSWLKVATVNAEDNDDSALTLKCIDKVLDVSNTGSGNNISYGYELYRYTISFARDGELAKQLGGTPNAAIDQVRIVAETDGGEDGWICLTEVEVFEGHPCYPVYDLTESSYVKQAAGDGTAPASELRPTFFRGFYDSSIYASELPAHKNGGAAGVYDAKQVFNREPEEGYTVDYVFGNVEQRAVDGRGIPYFYKGDQLLLRATNDSLSCDTYNYRGKWESNYKLLAESRMYFTDTATDKTTRLFAATAVPTPTTRCDVLARDRFTCTVPQGDNGGKNYCYLPVYMMNSLDYLKETGYEGARDREQYIEMPANKVELTGRLVWDTNYETDAGNSPYLDDKNGVSLNIAALGAKTNTAPVDYNGSSWPAGQTLRFGSIWYIDDTAYYNTHTNMKQYGTVVMRLSALRKYFNDELYDHPSGQSVLKSVFQTDGVELRSAGSAQPASAHILKGGVYYVPAGAYDGALYGDVLTVGSRYYGAKSKDAFEALKKIYGTVSADSSDEAVMKALDIYLSFVNGDKDRGVLKQNPNFEDFGGIAKEFRANKYYYFCNISSHFVPETYEDPTGEDKTHYKWDTTKETQNATELTGVYDYDQRYFEFDVPICGISDKSSKFVAVPYAIYADKYRFVEFGEHLADPYVKETWRSVFAQYYGGSNSENDVRRYKYGTGLARSIDDTLNKTSSVPVN